MMRAARFVPTVMVLALVAGCGGGQTGDLSGENGKGGKGTNVSSNGCDDQLSPIALDDASALGFDAASVLAFAEQSYQAPLAWQALPQVQYSPSASESVLTLSLSSRNAAWLVHSVPAKSTDEQGSGALLGVICPPDRLRVGVHAELQSTDGALAESFDATLDARSAYVATLRRAIVPEQVAGSFEISQVTAPPSGGAATAAVKDLTLDIVLTPGAMAGALSGQLTTQNSQVASSSSLTFARFPSDTRCASNQGGVAQAVPVSAESAALGQTGTDAMSQVNGSSALPIKWNDGATSALTLALSGLGDGCVQVAPYLGYEAPSQPAATVVYPVTLQATTADGRLQGQYGASLVSWPKLDGTGFSERIELNGTFAADALAATGFSQVAIPTGTQRLNVRLEALFEGAQASGKVTLDALQDPPCVTNPEPPSANSSPGCSGTMVTPVRGATWPR